MKKTLVGMTMLSCASLSLYAQTSEQLMSYKAAVEFQENFNRIQRESGMPEMDVPSFEEWLQKSSSFSVRNAEVVSLQSKADRWQKRMETVAPYLRELVPVGEKANDYRARVARAEQIRLRRLADAARINQIIRSRELNAIAAKYGVERIREIQNGHCQVLTGEADGAPVWIDNFDYISAAGIGVDRLWPTNISGLSATSTELDLTGSNITLGMWESYGYVATGHVEFNERVIQMDDPVLPSSHATSVAGTIAAGGEDYNLPGYGVADWARGVAYESTLLAYDTDSFSSELLAAAAGGNGIPSLRVSNHSWGSASAWWRISSMGDYWYNNAWYTWGGAPAWVWTQWEYDHEDRRCGQYLGDQTQGTGCAQIDEFMAEQAPRHLMVCAAGNARSSGPRESDTWFYFDEFDHRYKQLFLSNELDMDWTLGDGAYGFDTVMPPGTAKNPLTVGAVRDVYHFDATGAPQLGYAANSPPSEFYEFSGCGPTDDGRIKPDVVAVGAASSSVRPSYDLVRPTYAPADYTTNQVVYGTSFAAASVTGAFGLILERRGQLFPELDPEVDAWRGSTMKALAIHTADDIWWSGPDYFTGWGLFNAVSAVEQMELDARDGRGSHIKELELAVGMTNSWRVELTGEPFKVTIAWSDPAGTPPSGGIDDPTPMLVNNLDLWVENEDGAEVFLPWVLNPDLTNETDDARIAGATTGYDDCNNVEQVLIAEPDAGTYRIFVAHSGGLIGGETPTNQWVSVLTSGDTLSAPIIDCLEQSPTNGTFLVTFTCDPGAHLMLESSTDLASGNWMANEVLTTENEINSFLVSSMDAVKFWRLRRETGGAE